MCSQAKEIGHHQDANDIGGIVPWQPQPAKGLNRQRGQRIFLPCVSGLGDRAHSDLVSPLLARVSASLQYEAVCPRPETRKPLRRQSPIIIDLTVADIVI